MLGNEQAPGFRPRDSSGQGYSLDQFRGEVVVLTFLYTHCTDYCPLTAELLRNADAAAGHPDDVVYLAVSVDPVGDTADSVAKFQQGHRLDQLGSRWHYLLGDAGELSGVWRTYYIGVSRDLPPGEAGHSSAPGRRISPETSLSLRATRIIVDALGGLGMRRPTLRP